MVLKETKELLFKGMKGSFIELGFGFNKKRIFRKIN